MPCGHTKLLHVNKVKQPPFLAICNCQFPFQFLFTYSRNNLRLRFIDRLWKIASSLFVLMVRKKYMTVMNCNCLVLRQYVLNRPSVIILPFSSSSFTLIAKAKIFFLISPSPISFVLFCSSNPF